MTTKQLYVDGFTSVHDFGSSYAEADTEVNDVEPASQEVDTKDGKLSDDKPDSGDIPVEGAPIEEDQSVGDGQASKGSSSEDEQEDSFIEVANEEGEKDKLHGEAGKSNKKTKGSGKDRNKSPRPDWSRRKILLTIVISAILLVVVVFGGGWLYFRDKALPNSFVAGENVSRMTEQQIRDVVAHKQRSMKITIAGDQKDKLLLPTHEEIGLSFDTDKSVSQVMKLHRQGSLLSRFELWKPQQVTLAPHVDIKKLDKYMKANVKSATKDAKNAKLVFDDSLQSFRIENDKPGSGILLSRAEQILEKASLEAKSVRIDVPTQSIPAEVRSDMLKDELSRVNAYLDTAVSLQAGSSVVRPTRGERASWLDLKINSQNKYTVSVKQAAIRAYIASVSSPYKQETQKQISLKDKKTGKVTVLQAGVNGQDVVNQSDLVSALAQSFAKKQNYSGKMKVATTKFQSQDLTALPKWAFVSLTHQRLTAYEYDKPVKSFLISSGVAKYPSSTGVFSVWHKTPVQTMTGGSIAGGDYYSLPNVHWDTYYHKDEAVHEAYWHNNFGTPMSHGCLNASYDNAKWFYYFAPIGTTVVVVP